jgi:hypothetical protein
LGQEVQLLEAHDLHFEPQLTQILLKSSLSIPELAVGQSGTQAV